MFGKKAVKFSGVPRGGMGGSKSPPPKFRKPPKIVPNSTRLWKLLKITEFRTPTPQDVWKKGSKILKLPPVHNCFTLAMTNKLVGIINNLKVPKIKKILLYEMKFLARNYSCLQNPWLGGYRPQIPVLCPQLNLLNPPPPRTKFVGTPLLRIHFQKEINWIFQALTSFRWVNSHGRFERSQCLQLQSCRLWSSESELLLSQINWQVLSRLFIYYRRNLSKLINAGDISNIITPILSKLPTPIQRCYRPPCNILLRFVS